MRTLRRLVALAGFPRGRVVLAIALGSLAVGFGVALLTAAGYLISRAAELGPGDVVLEVGGGLGVLSEHLAERASHVHVVELDRRLEEALRDATDPHANITLHLADAVKLDLAALDPAPTKVVANLPYGVATLLLERLVVIGRQCGLHHFIAGGKDRHLETPAHCEFGDAERGCQRDVLRLQHRSGRQHDIAGRHVFAGQPAVGAGFQA